MSIKLLIHFDEDYKGKGSSLSEDEIINVLTERLEDISYIEEYEIEKTAPGLQAEQAKVRIKEHDLSLNSNHLSSKLDQDLGFSHKVQVLEK
jgi:DNA polymerase III delta prime subunit